MDILRLWDSAGQESEPVTTIAGDALDTIVRKCTCTRKNTLDPVWSRADQEAFLFYPSLHADETLSITLLDEDRLGPPEEIGTWSTSLRHLLRDSPPSDTALPRMAPVNGAAGAKAAAAQGGAAAGKPAPSSSSGLELHCPLVNSATGKAAGVVHIEVGFLGNWSPTQ
jgi:hypothetical protein